VRRAAAQGDIVRIEAVLNGTCNFILNRLAEGGPFDDALTAARDAGFAEEDPTADLTGLDAAAKLAILAHEGQGQSLRIDAIARQTLSADAVLPLGRVRQIARLDVASGRGGVAFEAVDGDALFAVLPDEANALRVTVADGRVFTATGRGAGRRPTAESVWADLEDLIEAR
jgi:homoserine dehydrogenase